MNEGIAGLIEELVESGVNGDGLARFRQLFRRIDRAGVIYAVNSGSGQSILLHGQAILNDVLRGRGEEWPGVRALSLAYRDVTSLRYLRRIVAVIKDGVPP